MARNAVIDLRYGGLLLGKTRTEFEHLGSRHVENTDYLALDQIFAGRIGPDDVLVDIGCGKGRVINWWLQQGHTTNRIVGLELDPDVADRTRRRLARHTNVTILTGDAIEQLPLDATLIYMYNPFTEPVVRRFVDRATTVYAEHGVRVLYYNCKHVDVFEDEGWSVDRLTLDSPTQAPFDALAAIRYNGADAPVEPDPAGGAEARDSDAES